MSEIPEPAENRRMIVVRKGQSLEQYLNPPPEVFKENRKHAEEINRLPTSQTWPLKFGAFIAAGFAAATGVYTTRQLRTALVLNQLGAKSTFLFAAGIPAMTAGGSHAMFVTLPLIDKGIAECPICVQVRSGLFQAMAGGIYGFMMGPMVTYPLVARLKSFRVPSLGKNPTAVINYFLELMRPMRSRLVPIILAQFILGMGLSWLEQRTYLSCLIPKVVLDEDSRDNAIILHS